MIFEIPSDECAKHGVKLIETTTPDSHMILTVDDKIVSEVISHKHARVCPECFPEWETYYQRFVAIQP